MKLKNLHLGIYEKALPLTMSWGKKLQTAADLQFQFIEMSIDETDDKLSRLHWDLAERKKIRRALEKTEVKIVSMCLSGHRRFPFGSHNARVRKKALEIMKKAIELCVDLGIRTIQLAGYDVYYEKCDASTKKWFLEGLQRSVALAEEKNVMLGMEIMDHPTMNSITKFLSYKKKIPSCWFNVYPDIGNLSAWGNDIAKELELGLHYITGIHLKDTLAVTKKFPGKFREVPFGTGCVDFASVFRILKKLHYNGPFLIEMWTQNSKNALTEIANARRWILIQMRDAKFLE